MSRPQKQTSTGRVYLSLDEPDMALLKAYALQTGRPAATVAGQLVVNMLRGARDSSGAVDPELIANVLQQLKGDTKSPVQLPRWRWPLDRLLGHRERQWWDRWLPQLNQLMGRTLEPNDIALGERSGPLLDDKGYSDLLEFLLPTQGTVSWRSLDYRKCMRPELRPTWEPTIRHVARALEALEDAESTEAGANASILVQANISGPWLRTLLAITGLQPPELLPKQRLA
ncbi:hypothetical protein [Candidatus Nephthysia bennettiae]|uniref:Uncharacterized protein n=1 Tax=Candidatus Nephthysia bennettiae TaxID=3127016 RepID=A0A934N8A0_9BACT|nr:hypothetical protein [Candidatus Dormibacteraeota bacterium]